MTERIFNDDDHWQTFTEIINKMQKSDIYHMSVAYLLALDTVTRNHVNEILDFEEDCIKLESLEKAWQTSKSKKTTRLAFNLWNGSYYDSDEPDTSCKLYAVGEIFSSDYAPFYWQALKIRFPESCGKTE